jgi:hypothetical protein
VSQEEFEKSARQYFVTFALSDRKKWTKPEIELINTWRDSIYHEQGHANTAWSAGKIDMLITRAGVDHLYPKNFFADNSLPPEEGPATPEEASEQVATFEEQVSKHMVDSYSIRRGRTRKITFFGDPMQSRSNELLEDRLIAMPPGYRMERAARWLFFFSRKTFRRISEEIIADYRHELVEAEARGQSNAEQRALKIQHWGGFLLAVVDELWSGIVGKIVKAFKGS